MSEHLSGTFRARAVEWVFGYSSKGTPQVEVTFELTDDNADGAGYRLRWFGYLSDAAKKRTLEAMRYCGWDNDDVTAPTGLNANEVDLVIEPDEYNGKVSPRVKWVNRVGGLGLKPDELDPGQKRAFAAQLKADAIESRKGMPQRSANNNAPAAAPRAAASGYGAPPPDDDVPF